MYVSAFRLYLMRALYLLIFLGLGVQIWPQFILLWKVLWVVAIALPAWLSGGLDEDMQEAFVACMWGVVLCPIAIPWGYVFANYIKKPGDRWRWSSSRSPRDATMVSAP